MKSSSVEQLILDLFAQAHMHLTAQEVYTHLKSHLPAVNPSTVYRALERMAHAGKVSVSDMGTGAAVYEGIGRELHHHLVCENCHRVVTIESAVIQPWFDKLARRYAFTMTTNHLILFGYCPDCRKGCP